MGEWRKGREGSIKSISQNWMVKSVIAVVEVDLNRIVVRSMDRHDQDAKQSRRMMLSASTNTPTNYEQFTTAHLPLNIYIRITEKKTDYAKAFYELHCCQFICRSEHVLVNSIIRFQFEFRPKHWLWLGLRFTSTH